MPYRVLVSAPYLIPHLDRILPVLHERGVEVIPAEVQERLEEDQLLAFAGKIDGIICGDDRLSQRVLEAAAPQLKVISKWGTGVDSIDLEAAKQLGIQVFNSPGAFTEAVADTVMGYVLAFARSLPWMDQETKAGSWVKRKARALHECSLGVVGVGQIGNAVLRRAKAFGMGLLGNDIVEIDPDFVSAVELRMVSLEELLRQSDFVSLNCDLNPSSRGLINADRLKIMKAGAVLINTARGPVVVESDLVDALRSGQLGGAALDVFEVEPLPADSPLRWMANVLLAPHNANSSPSAWERVHWNSIRNLLVGLGLEPPPAVELAGTGIPASPTGQIS